MADNLIFPIGFDLEKGVKDVISRSDTYLRQIEHAMNRKPIVLRAEVDASKFQMFSRQFTNSIDGISAKLAQAQRLWNAMTFDVKFDADGNLSRRAQVVFDAFQQLTQASATMGQRLGEVNRNLAKSEQDTARAITAEYDKRRQQVNEQIRLKERQAAAEERVRQGQLKGVNAGYVETQRQVEAVRNLRLQYEAILPMLNAMAQRRYDIKVGIDKQFEADIQRINAEIARLRQSNLQLGAKGDTNAIQANLQAIRQLEAELQRISQQKVDLLNSNKINSDLARLRTEISSVFGELQSAERRLAADNSLNAALDAQSQKVLKLHADIQKLDQQFAQLNATGKAYNQDGSFTAQANTLLQQRIALTKQLEQEAITGQQAQIKLEQQLREEKRQTEQAAKNAAKEAERQAKAEAAARKQAQDAANAENKARQEAYNARRRQGQETQRILNKEAKSIADITAKLQIQQQRLQSANIGSAKFNKIAEEVKRLTADLEKANQKMRELTGQTQSGAARQSAAVKQVTNEFKHQDGYVSRLIKSLAVYASFSYVGNFLTSVREVTAQFELQRVSLGAILQDANKGEQIFSQIKQFALKSPISILDLTKYTKQLAAYKIGYDELFDTTKRLADVSVGLGVDFQRIVLLYGQVRATGHLRASEVRQATEAGIPLVEELAAKLTKANGELVTAADVMDMISKRAISFDMVKDVFTDMTSAGGAFYNMQEKQGNTLYGLWAKLGDAASVMYDEIGNTESINKGMKAGIQALTDLMRNWQQIPRMIAFVGAATLVFITRQKILKLETAKVAAIQETYNARMARTNMLLSSSSRLTRAHGFALGVQARMLKMASTAAAAFGTSLTAIKSAIISTGWGALILALGYVADKLIFTKTNAEKAAEAISKVSEETATETAKSVRNFEYLANKAVNAPKGSTEQKEALEELERTYSNILPKELLELEYLDKLDGKYGSLTKTIREYIAEQQRRKAIEEIGNVYGAEKQKYERKLTDYFREQGWTEGEIARFWEKFYDVAKDKSKGLQQVVAESVKFAGREGFEDVFKLLQSQNSATKEFDKARAKDLGEWAMWGRIDYIDMLRDAVLEENQAIEQNEERTKAAQSATNAFAEEQEKAAKRLKEVRLVDSKGEAVDRDSYLGGQMLANFEIKDMTNILKDGFAQAGLVWDAEYGNFINHINEKTPELISSLNFDAIIDALIKALDNDKLTEEQRKFLENLLSLAQTSKERYEEIVPADPIVRVAQTRFKQIAQSAGGFREQYNQYLMKAGEDMATYNKRLKDSLEGLKNRVKALLHTQKVIAKAGIFAKMLYGVSAEELQKDIDETNKTISIIEKTLSEQPDYSKSKNKGSKGTKSDPRLQILNEMVQLAEKLNKEYSDWEKKVGSTTALEKVNATYAETVKYAEKVAKDAGISLPHLKTPTNAKELNDYLEAVRKVMESAKGLKGGKKAAIELAVKMSNNVSAEDQKAIEEKIKALADRISRTKTAKEFYEKILSQTGDVELAVNLSLSIYGENGEDLDKAIRDNIQATLGKNKQGIDLDFSAAIRADGSVDYNALTKIAKGYLDMGEISEETYNKILKMRDEDRKDMAKTVEGWLKATEKAKTYSDKMLDITRTTAVEIAKINTQKQHTQADIDKLLGLPQTDETRAEIARLQALLLEYDVMIQRFKDKQAEEQTKLGYEAFKDSPMYVQIFDDLDNASTTMLRNMKQRMTELQGEWNNLDPTQLKELQSRLNEIDEQLVKRNPFKGLVDGIKAYRNLRKNGDERGNKSESDANKDLDAAAKRADAARKLFQEELQKYAQEGESFEELIKRYQEAGMSLPQGLADAKKDLDAAMADEKAAQTAVKNWEKVRKAIGLSANELFQMLNWAGDIAKGIADISEAMGADEEDVQYWNDVADALGQISGGIQDIVSAAMSGNVTGIISSTLTAIPKMFVGFANLFSAGKVKRANKEIKRQQKLLDQLEYTYGRLEAAADKLFGRDYVNNYNQQLKNLQAQQAAYEKQAAAERSKGKKKDKEKIKEYENQARDTADKIKELQDDLVAHFTGSTKTDVARQMAKSWVDARASMSDTFAAIKGDYQDLIKNMIVEGAAARVIENALTPVWDSMEKMLAKNDVQGAIDSLIGGMDSALNAANNGMEVLWKALEARGYDMKSLISNTDSEYSGMAKSVAGATSEEINNVAAIGNTLMYYVSPIPRIDENLARVVAIMEGRGTALPMASGVTTGAVDYTEMFTTANQHLSSLPRMEQHLAEIHTMLGRALKTKGSTTGFNTFLNS